MIPDLKIQKEAGEGPPKQCGNASFLSGTASLGSTEVNSVADLGRNKSNDTTTGKSEHIRTPAPTSQSLTAYHVRERLAAGRQ